MLLLPTTLTLAQPVFAETAGGSEPKSSDGLAGAIASIVVTLITTTGTIIWGAFKFNKQSKRQDHLHDQQVELQGKADDHEVVLAQLTGAQATELARLNAELSAKKDTRKDELQRFARNSRMLDLMALRLGATIERIQYLASASKSGRVSSDLAINSPSFKETIYDLFAPIAIARLSVDLDLQNTDLRLWNLFVISRCLLLVMHADDELAQAARLDYKPNELRRDGATIEPKSFRIYDPQGIILLDNALQGFANEGADTADDPAELLLSRSAFSKRFSGTDGFDQRMAEIRALVGGFSPSRKPVFWQILVTQAYLARLAKFVDDDLSKVTTSSVFSMRERRQFDWRSSRDRDIPDEDVLDRPFSVAEAWSNAQIATVVAKSH